jgi:hypothetical protein
VLKLRLQTDPSCAARGLAGALSSVVRTEGAGALFKGLSLNWLKGPLATAVSFTAFEALSTRMRAATTGAAA